MRFVKSAAFSCIGLLGLGLLGPLYGQEEQPKSSLVTLRGSQIPFYKVVGAFVASASYFYQEDPRGVFRSYVSRFGLDPDLESVATLHQAFSELNEELSTMHLSTGQQREMRRAEVLGRLFAQILNDIRLREDDPLGVEGTFRHQLETRTRADMSVGFIDEEPSFELLHERQEHFDRAVAQYTLPATSSMSNPSFLRDLFEEKKNENVATVLFRHRP